METQLDAGQVFPLAVPGQVFISLRNDQQGRVTVPSCINTHQGSERLREDHAEDSALTAGWSQVWESHSSWNAAQGSEWEVTFSPTE